MKTISLSAFVLAMLAAQGAGAEDLVKRGEYLARIIDCQGCHTTGALVGKPDPAMHLAGSTVGFGIPDIGVFYPSNLTPDRETGLGNWSDEDLVRALRTGMRPDGRQLAPVMPWPSYAALSDADAKALAAYLKILPAVRHQAPPPAGTSSKPVAPYLSIIAPE